MTGAPRAVSALFNPTEHGAESSRRALAKSLKTEHLFSPSPRAVGQALRANPLSPQVPCHRVIASDLTLGGFKGHTSGQALAEKLRLLATEGIIFENGRLSDPRRALR